LAVDFFQPQYLIRAHPKLRSCLLDTPAQIVQVYENVVLGIYLMFFPGAIMANGGSNPLSLPLTRDELTVILPQCY